jgi:hypothetical protein
LNKTEIIHKNKTGLLRNWKSRYSSSTEQVISQPSLDVNSIWPPFLPGKKYVKV